MNNPNSPRETWKEFEQEMQDFVLSVLAVMEEEWGDQDNVMRFDLIEWVEYRYLDGRNFTDAEEEYVAWENHWND